MVAVGSKGPEDHGEKLKIQVNKAQKNGASIMKPATNAGNMGRFAIIIDPVGTYSFMANLKPIIFFR